MMTLFRESKERMDQYALAQEKSRLEWEERAKRLDKKISDLGDRVGQLVESMVEGGVVRLFRALGYSFNDISRAREFRQPALGISGEIDLFLENGDVALLVEVKTNLSVDDVKDHIERLEKFRSVADFRKDRRRFIAAVGGGVVRESVRNFALKQGMYVIHQSGENVEVISPDGEPRVW
jgi:hypothetical protein